ncbi:hypothetical protein ACEWY4_017309 [Coilia grayii]|uniref:Immunoglobulin domain-containing protein n=1 Tax=Coilia grayii TaxID=363190 RepID=A0ABD1JIQ4_9TELE
MLKVTGLVGGEVVIRCPFEKAYRHSTKYLQREVPGGYLQKLVQTPPGGEGTTASSGKYSLSDDQRSGVVTVTIGDLSVEDAGDYRCGASTGGPFAPYHYISLYVRHSPGFDTAALLVMPLLLPSSIHQCDTTCPYNYSCTTCPYNYSCTTCPYNYSCTTCPYNYSCTTCPYNYSCTTCPYNYSCTTCPYNYSCTTCLYNYSCTTCPYNYSCTTCPYNYSCTTSTHLSFSGIASVIHRSVITTNIIIIIIIIIIVIIIIVIIIIMMIKFFPSSQSPAASSQLPVPSNQFPATSPQQPVTSNLSPATSPQPLRVYATPPKGLKENQQGPDDYENTGTYSNIHSSPSASFKAKVRPGTEEANGGYVNVHVPEAGASFHCSASPTTSTGSLYQTLSSPSCPADSVYHSLHPPAASGSDTGPLSPVYLSLDSQSSQSECVYDSLQ